MIKINTKTINLDVSKKLYEKLVAKQGDTQSRFLLFNLSSGGAAIDLTSRSVRVYAVKPDGREVFNDLVISNATQGTCILELTNQMLAIPGTVKMELMIIEGLKKLTSFEFELEVIKSLNRETSIVSTNEFTALINGLASLEEYDNYKNEIKAARKGERSLLEKINLMDSIIADWENFKANGGTVGGNTTISGNLVASKHHGNYFTRKTTNNSLASGDAVVIGVESANGSESIMIGAGLVGSTKCLYPSINNEIALGLSSNSWKELWLGAFTKSHIGYTTLPNGLILQWGTIAIAVNKSINSVGNAMISFPIAFPNAVLNSGATCTSNSGYGNANSMPHITASIFATSNAGATVFAYTPTTLVDNMTFGVSWFAIGY